MATLGLAGLVIGALSATVSAAIVVFVLFVETSEWRQRRRDLRERLRVDREVEALDAIWALDVRVGSSLPMRPARHSRNRLHRGF